MAAPAAGDTIVACATAAGTGGVAIIRISGPEALAVAARLTGRDAWPDRQLVRARISTTVGARRRIDDGLAVAMRGPRSFTGEDVVELHVHGGPVNVSMVLAAVVVAGARPAEPGEFTRRALEAGKVSVAEAEAMLAVINAPSSRAWALAQDQLDGALSRRVEELRGGAAELLAALEASIDFPEEDLPPLLRDELTEGFGQLAAACLQLTASFEAGRSISNGIVVALVGAVNAGKSSLLNALVGSERVLVSDEPGTTRDYVEVRTTWNGVAVTLIDTAGERDAVGVERRGIELGRRRAASADLVLHLHGPDDPIAPPAPRTILVATKTDLPWAAPAGRIHTSTVTGAGIDELRAAVLRELGLADDPEAGSAVILTERQRAAASAAMDGFRAAHAAMAAEAPLEVVALEARAGAAALAALQGDEVGEDVRDALFARFCIGK